MKQSERITAIHEAGHYVARWALKDNYGDTLSIVADHEKGTLGHVKPLYEVLWLPDGTVDTGSVRAYVISLYAGAAAQRRVDDDEEAIVMGASSDFEMAEEYLPCPEEDKATLLKATDEIVEKHWTVIERLADELQQHQKLSAEEASFIVDGDMESLAEYRLRFSHYLK